MGEPTGMINRNPGHQLIEYPRYEAVHKRLMMLHGIAATHRCVDCTGQAAQWSYNGGAPDERHKPGTGYPFTTDLTYYSPRCHKCHRAYDRRTK